MRRWQAVLAALMGVLIMASAFAHAIAGWPSVRPVLQAAAVRQDVIEGLAIEWHFGSASMFALGLIAFAEGIRGMKATATYPVSLLVIALIFLGFGVYAYVVTGYEVHFLIFIAFGVLLALSALRRSSA